VRRSVWVAVVLGMLLIGSLAAQAAVPTLATTTTPTPSASPQPRIELDDELWLRPVADGVFIVTHAFPWAANSLIVEMADDTIVLVDTPYTAEATAQVIAWITAEFGKREIVAINTGFHVDNLGGNAYLAEQGIPIYGSDLTVQMLDERGEQSRALTLEWLQAPADKRYYDGHRDVLFIAPTEVFAAEDGLELDFGGERLQVYYPGPTHAPDNMVVFFPEHRLMFGGCMIIGGDKLGNTADADLEAWPDSVRKLARFEFDILVPGHGDRFDPELLDHTLDLLTS
jgi:metallo-beta-lactamase class B